MDFSKIREFVRQNYPDLHRKFEELDLDRASRREEIEAAFNRLQAGGLSIPVSRFNRDIAELSNARDRLEGPHLHAFVSAGDTVSPWEASVNQAIAETHKLQDQCRGCRNRNRDFDGHVAPDHLIDLKCAINPIYAMDGVGECADFEAGNPAAIAKRPLTQDEHLRIQLIRDIRDLVLSLADAIESVPSVARVDIAIDLDIALPLETTYVLHVIRQPEQPSQRFQISYRDMNSPSFQDLRRYILSKVMDGDH